MWKTTPSSGLLLSFFFSTVILPTISAALVNATSGMFSLPDGLVFGVVILIFRDFRFLSGDGTLLLVTVVSYLSKSASLPLSAPVSEISYPAPFTSPYTMMYSSSPRTKFPFFPSDRSMAVSPLSFSYPEPPDFFLNL